MSEIDSIVTASDDFGIDLDNLNPGARFFWPYGRNETEEWVEFRVASEDDMRTIRKKLSIKTKVEYPVNRETRQVNRIETLNLTEDKQLLLDEEINDFCIGNWRLLDKNGKEIPCTRENKNRLMRGMPKFSAWAAKCLKKMREDNTAEAEVELGN